MHLPGFLQSLPGDGPHAIQEWQPGVEAEVGVDQFCLMALEFELMLPPPPTVTVPKCVTESSCKCNKWWGWQDGDLGSKEQSPTQRLRCNASDS